MPQDFSVLKNLRYDVPAAIVVLLVALPLCLGIALASGAPLFSGLIAGVVGGIVVGLISKSPLSVSGPAAGLTVIVLDAIQSLPSYEVFLVAVVLAGLLQILFGILRTGLIGDFIPSSVIKGMLCAIGLILIIKQVPHAVGFNSTYLGNETFEHGDGQNSFTSLFEALKHITPGAAIISGLSLVILAVWDKIQPKQKSFLRYLPGALIVVIVGVLLEQLFLSYPLLALKPEQLVNVPSFDSVQAFLAGFSTPDFNALDTPGLLPKVIGVAVTLALVASIETLLSIEAIDNIDPYKRVTPTNRELVAQGFGNTISGLVGGLPVTSVIVRSSANTAAGARTRVSTILHGILMFICVIAIPSIINQIPLSALAAVLISVGYKLAKPSLFIAKYKKGWSHFVPFVVTVAAILLTDLLKGIGIGLVVGIFFVLIENTRSAIFCVKDGNNYLIRFKRDLFFIHKHELKKDLSSVEDGSSVLIDMSRITFIDVDNIEIIHDFVERATHSNIRVTFKINPDCAVGNQFKEANV